MKVALCSCGTCKNAEHADDHGRTTETQQRHSIFGGVGLINQRSIPARKLSQADTAHIELLGNVTVPPACLLFLGIVWRTDDR